MPKASSPRGASVNVASLDFAREQRLAKIATLAAAVVGIFAGTCTQATIVSANTIIGVFSDPVYSGYEINTPTVGQNTFVVNSSTAPATTIIANGATSSSLQWGTGADLGIPVQEQSSVLTFSGATNVPANSTTPIQIGTINLFNGTSDLDSVIYGATLSFYLNSVSSGNFLGADNVVINTTANQFSGTGLSASQLAEDADYLNICGHASNICQSSIEAFEAAEGGVGVLVDLDGTIIDDPQLTLTSVSLDPNQPPGGVNGVIGNELPLALIPEPASLVLLGTGLVGFVGVRRWRHKGA